MKKPDLAAILIDRFGLSKKDANAALDALLDEIARSLSKGDPVAIAGFGTFKKKVVPAKKARVGRNPFTGEMQKFAAKKASSKPTFTPAKGLKDVVTGAVKLPAAPKAPAKPVAAKAPVKKAAAKPVAKKAAAKPVAKKAAAKPVAKKAPAKKAPVKK